MKKVNSRKLYCTLPAHIPAQQLITCAEQMKYTFLPDPSNVYPLEFSGFTNLGHTKIKTKKCEQRGVVKSC